MTIDNHILKELDLNVNINEEVDITLITGEDSLINKELEIAKFQANPIQLCIGTFPIIVTPICKILVGAVGMSSSKLTFSSKQMGFIVTNLYYKQLDEWIPTGTYSNIYSYSSPNVINNANLMAYIKVILTFKFYNTDSFSINTILYEELFANFSQTKPWHMYIGAETGMDMKLSIFDSQMIDYSRDDLISYRERISQGD
jgi:hypothetical protein